MSITETDGSEGNEKVPVRSEGDEAVQAGLQAYKESLRLRPDTIAAYVIEKVGQRIGVLGTGLSDARSLRKWAEGGEVRASNEGRLRLLYRVARTIEIVYDQETARAFLRSTSPYLGDRAPIEAIADEDDEVVLEAVRYFLEP